MEASEPEDEELWVLLGSPTIRSERPSFSVTPRIPSLTPAPL